MKRILLFLATNIAVLVILSIVASLLGVGNFLDKNGLNMTSLLVFAAVFGFGGSFHIACYVKMDGQTLDGSESYY